MPSVPTGNDSNNGISNNGSMPTSTPNISQYSRTEMSDNSINIYDSSALNLHQDSPSVPKPIKMETQDYDSDPQSESNSPPTIPTVAFSTTAASSPAITTTATSAASTSTTTVFSAFQPVPAFALRSLKKIMAISSETIEGGRKRSMGDILDDESSAPTVNKRPTTRSSQSQSKTKTAKTIKKDNSIARPNETNPASRSAINTRQSKAATSHTAPINPEADESVDSDDSLPPNFPLNQSTRNGAKKKIAQAPKPASIPAIIITQRVSADQLNKIADAGIKCEFSFYANTVHVFAISEADRAAAINIIKTFAQGYARRTKPPNLLRVTASGFPNAPLAHIKEAILDAGLQTTDVRLIRTIGQASFIAVDFERSKMSLQTLQTDFNRIFESRIKWAMAKKKPKGPVMCYRCCMWGHGQLGCFRPSVCFRCGEGHLGNACPHNSLSDANDNTTTKHRCVNCANRGLPFKHLPNSDACPIKIQFITDSNKKLGNSSNTTKKSGILHQPMPDKASASEKASPHFDAGSLPERTFASLFSSTDSGNNNAHNNNNIVPHPIRASTSSLGDTVSNAPLPAGPLLSDMFAVLRRLSNCTSRQQQFAILEESS